MQIQASTIASQAIQAMYSANKAIATASQRISTGLRINSAADDPAGLITATGLKTNIQAVSKSIDSVNSGLGVTGVVDSALSSISSVLSDMYTLASSYSSYTDDDYETAMNAYMDEITSLASSATYNGTSVLASTQTITLGSGDFAPNSLTLTKTDLTTLSLSGGATDITNRSSHSAASTLISTAIDTITSYQGSIGAQANVLSYHMDYLDGLTTAYSSAYGNIMNADLAQESANLAAAQVKRDGATAMLAQANSMNKDIVSYLLKSIN